MNQRDRRRGSWMIRLTKFALLALAAASLTPAPAAAQDSREPLLVNYGVWARPRQGDNDHAQVIYLSVPATTSGKLYVKVFDPDTGGAYDLVQGRSNTRMRYEVFGGPGAFVPPTSATEKITDQERTAGELLGEATFGSDRQTDSKWVTIAEVDPAQGDHVGDRIIYRLLVEGTQRRRRQCL